MSAPGHGPGPGPDYTGRYRISQGELYLTDFNGRAVTAKHNIGGQFVWEVTHADPALTSSANLIYPGLTFTLLPSGSIEPAAGITPGFTLVLTLGGVNGIEPIPILLEQSRQMPSFDQQWTLSEVTPNTPFPAIFTAYILPAAKEGSVAATGPTIEVLPGTRRNVDAVPRDLPLSNKLWQFVRVLENE